MLEDIRRNLTYAIEIGEFCNDTANEIEQLFSLIDKYKEALEEIIDIDGNNKATYAQDIAEKALKETSLPD